MSLVDTQDSSWMMIHHCVTLLLMVGSYTYNLGRIGALVLVTHDLADPLLMVTCLPTCLSICLLDCLPTYLPKRSV